MEKRETGENKRASYIKLPDKQAFQLQVSQPHSFPLTQASDKQHSPAPLEQGEDLSTKKVPWFSPSPLQSP